MLEYQIVGHIIDLSVGNGVRWVNKKDLSERDICSKYITPSLIKSGWDLERQIREEVTFTDGRIIVRKKLVTRGERKRADYILYYKSNLPLAIIEAKDNKHSVGAGMQQALDYAEILDIPFVYSSNGDAFLEHVSFSSLSSPQQGDIFQINPAGQCFLYPDILL